MYCSLLHRSWTVIVAVIFIFFVLPSSYGSTGEFKLAPGNSRTFSYSTTFCQSLRIKSAASKPVFSRWLYLLRDEPPLNRRDSFTINYIDPGMSLLGKRNNKSFNYYLYPGSNFSMEYCLELTYPQPVNFFLIRKESEFNSWEDNPSSKYALTTTTINNSCAQGKESFSYNITSAEEYYFVFYNPSSICTALLNVSMQFERMLYNITKENVARYCQIIPGWNTTCSVDVPYGSDNTALVNVNAADKQTDFYGTKVTVDWECDVRVWIYVVIIAPPLVFLVACVITVVIVCCTCYCRIKRRRKYRSLTQLSSAAPTLTVDTIAPPPYSPGYGTMSGETRCHMHSVVTSDFTESPPVTADTPKPPQPPSKEQLDSAPLHRQHDMQESPPSYESAVAGTAALL